MTRISDPPPEANRVPWERSPSSVGAVSALLMVLRRRRSPGGFFSKLEQQRMNDFVIAHHCFLINQSLQSFEILGLVGVVLFVPGCHYQLC